MKSYKLAALFTIIASPLLLQAAASAPAAQKDSGTIVKYANTREIYEKSVRGKAIQKQLAEEQASLATAHGFEAMQSAITAQEKKVMQRQEDVRKLEENFKSKAASMSEDDRKKEMFLIQEAHRSFKEEYADLERLMTKAQEKGKEVEKRLGLLHQELMVAFEADLKEACEALLPAQGWDSIELKDIAIAISKRVDATPAIIKALDDKEAKRQADKKAQAALTKSTK